MFEKDKTQALPILSELHDLSKPFSQLQHGNYHYPMEVVCVQRDGQLVDPSQVLIAFTFPSGLFFGNMQTEIGVKLFITLFHVAPRQA